MAKNGNNKERSPVPIQKGKINADQRTMQHNYRSEITKEDARESKMRFDNQCIYRVQTPKQ